MKRLLLILILIFSTKIYATTYCESDSVENKYTEEWLYSLRKPQESLMTALIHYYKMPENISRVFYCLAVTNTQRFANHELVAANNLYMLCDEEKDGKYYHYNHWSESVSDILEIYKQELGKDIYDMTDLLDCITSHHGRDKIKQMSRYHELYFGKPLPIRSDAKSNIHKKKGGLPW
ncbi:MAG: hypothetical protein MJZ01_08785 [Bacteroidales bacterium]|nr:hypothetical protein [Bacteroidales bacterium]